MEVAYFNCVEIDENVELSFVPSSLYDADDGDGNACCDQAIFNGRRCLLVFQEPNDRAHERGIRQKSLVTFLYRKSF